MNGDLDTFLKYIKETPEGVADFLFDDMNRYQKGDLLALKFKPFLNKEMRSGLLKNIKNTIYRGENKGSMLKNKIYYYSIFNDIDDLSGLLKETVETAYQSGQETIAKNNRILNLFFASTLLDKGTSVIDNKGIVKDAFIKEMSSIDGYSILNNVVAVVPAKINKKKLQDLQIQYEPKDRFERMAMLYEVKKRNPIEQDMIVNITSHLVFHNAELTLDNNNREFQEKIHKYIGKNMKNGKIFFE